MTFIEAAKILKDGGKVRRTAWDKTKLFIFGEKYSHHRKEIFVYLTKQNGRRHLPFSSFLIPELEDILSNDWKIVEDKGLEQ